jgi:hypothetical protein
MLALFLTVRPRQPSLFRYLLKGGPRSSHADSRRGSRDTSGRSGILVWIGLGRAAGLGRFLVLEL